jgi:(R,R)-butanediol dehydrogenase/meso-butanediol dehydrogenase/diacetyl reductase
MHILLVRTLVVSLAGAGQLDNILGGTPLKALLLKGPEDIHLEDVPVPTISDDEVLVEVKFCGICGTDLHSVSNCEPYKAGTYLGHEFSGILAQVGKGVVGWGIDDRVVVRPRYMCGECWACQHGRQSLCVHGFGRGIGLVPGIEYAGAFAKFVRVPVPKWRLLRLPAEVSFEEGALVEPLACSLHAVRVSAFKQRERVMVLGAGTIGLGVIAHLKDAGAGLIIATETVESRAELAKRLGADFVFNPNEVPTVREEVMELTNGNGVDVVFECSGIAEVFSTATDFLRPGGQIMLVGVVNKGVTILPMNFTFNEWEMKGTITSYADEFPMAIEFLQRSRLPAVEMITSKIKLSRIIENGINVLRKPSHREVKIIVQPD